MPKPQDIKTYYLEHRVPNPVNVTLTQKQCVDGEWLDDLRSEQNFRHFANKLNSSVLGARFKRFGKRLAILVVREHDATHRHHLHCIIERPEHLSEPLFFLHIKSCWTSTRFGYNQIHLEQPTTAERELGWVDYCLKRRTKTLYSDSIDWSNSTCFELR